jgi:starch synthase
MKIAFVSSEVVPFSKTGGLADVAGALPKFLEKRGHEVIVFTPLYKMVWDKFQPSRTKGRISVPVGSDSVAGEIWKDKLPDSNVTVYFIANDAYFYRDGLYGEKKGSDYQDYSDNCSRFVFFSRGVLDALKVLGFKPDVIHSNDWQAGLVPVYAKAANGTEPAVARAANVYTIHNLNYQGLFWHWDIPLTNIGWEHFNYKELEFYGKINFMKGAIVFSDTITTVSPTYAREIQTPEMGAGLEGVLKERGADLVGILNGIDYSVWNPEIDDLLPAKYSVEDMAGKAQCKAQLQKEAGLAVRPDVPLIGAISRLVDDKGFDLVAAIVDQLMQERMQLVVLGTGLEKYHKLFEDIARKYPDKAAAFIKFDNRLAHLIEAGSDMFLMPSRMEPCGLNQMFSLRYGTVPIVRATGGLADTVTDATPEAAGSARANGFSFVPYESGALLETVRRALALYGDKRSWARLVETGMKQDWSWDHSAAEYERVYKDAAKKKRPAGR